MSSQPYLCRFSYTQYLSRVRPAFQEILVGNWSEWLAQKYQSSFSPPYLLDRICSRQRLADCDCFTEDLTFKTRTRCIGYREWANLELLTLFEQVLLDECIIDYLVLPKNFIYLDSTWNEAFVEMGWDDPTFQGMLMYLCSRWADTWINGDNQGVSGYLSPEEVMQLHCYLEPRLIQQSPQRPIDSDFFYADEYFDEFIAVLRAIEQLARQAVAGNDGLLWSRDLMSLERRMRSTVDYLS